MTRAIWAAENTSDPTNPVENSVLVSLNFMTSAIRRKRALIAVFACIGLVAGLAVSFLTSVKQTATASVLLTHDPTQDPDRAAATDVALAQTNDVAGMAAKALGLRVTPQDFAKTIKVTKVTDDVLRISVSGPNSDAAKKRATEVVSAFLTFRSAALARQSNVVVTTLQQRIAQLNSQISSLTSQINATNPSNSSTLSDLIAQRTQASAQIGTLQNQADAALLSTSSITSTSRPLDSATSQPASRLKRVALDAAGGLLAGALLSMLAVVIAALLSWRVRRREDAADAIDAPVRSLRSARRYTRAERRMLMRLVEESTADDRTLAWVATGSTKQSAKVLATAARELQSHGRKVLVVDLAAGHPLRFLRKPAKGKAGPAYLAAEGTPGFEGRPLAAVEPLRGGAENPQLYSEVDLVLVFATVDPAVGAEDLAGWADTAIVTVAVGECPPEILHTTAELLRIAGIPVTAGILLNADRTDQSLGLPLSSEQHSSLARAVAP